MTVQPAVHQASLTGGSSGCQRTRTKGCCAYKRGVCFGHALQLCQGCRFPVKPLGYCLDQGFLVAVQGLGGTSRAFNQMYALPAAIGTCNRRLQNLVSDVHAVQHGSACRSASSDLMAAGTC